MLGWVSRLAPRVISSPNIYAKNPKTYHKTHLRHLNFDWTFISVSTCFKQCFTVIADGGPETLYFEGAQSIVAVVLFDLRSKQVTLNVSLPTSVGFGPQKFAWRNRARIRSASRLPWVFKLAMSICLVRGISTLETLRWPFELPTKSCASHHEDWRIGVEMPCFLGCLWHYPHLVYLWLENTQNTSLPAFPHGTVIDAGMPLLMKESYRGLRHTNACAVEDECVQRKCLKVDPGQKIISRISHCIQIPQSPSPFDTDMIPSWTTVQTDDEKRMGGVIRRDAHQSRWCKLYFQSVCFRSVKIWMASGNCGLCSDNFNIQPKGLWLAKNLSATFKFFLLASTGLRG